MKITQLLLCAAVQPPRSPPGDGPLAGTGGEHRRHVGDGPGPTFGLPRVAGAGGQLGAGDAAIGAACPMGMPWEQLREASPCALLQGWAISGPCRCPHGHPQPPKTQIQEGLPLLSPPRAWSGGDSSSPTVAAVCLGASFCHGSPSTAEPGVPPGHAPVTSGRQGLRGEPRCCQPFACPGMQAAQHHLRGASRRGACLWPSRLRHSPSVPPPAIFTGNICIILLDTSIAL